MKRFERLHKTGRGSVPGQFTHHPSSAARSTSRPGRPGILSDLWADEAGFILSAEMVIIATVVVLGLTAMLVAVRDSIGGEMTDLAKSFRNIDQSYGYSGMRGCKTVKGWTSWTAGSSFLDERLKDKYPEEIIVEDHVVGTVNGVKQPCTPPLCEGPICPAPPCVVPPCRTPDCLPAPCTTPDCVPQGAPLQSPPPLEAPCLDCEGTPGTTGRLPPPSSDLPPASSQRTTNAYYPPFYSPGTQRAYGPLQVW